MKKFTPNQTAAIETTATDVAVIAGPGSGKTTVLVERMAREIRNGLNPGAIVFITFTNAAAREVEVRLSERLGYQNTTTVLGYSGTIHGYALRIIKQFGDRISLPKIISVLSEEDAKEMIKATRDEQLCKATLKEIDAALALGPDFFLNFRENRPRDLDPHACNVACAYFQKMKGSGVMDFDRLLDFAVMVLESMDKHEVPLVVPALYWDECQDSGDTDHRLMELIAAQTRFVVGDPDQSIYGFRKAKPERFLRYVSKSDREVITLEENFRCGLDICEVANNLIGKNTKRVGKITDSATGIDGDVQCWTGFDEDGELKALAQSIRTRPVMTECAVLVRNNKLVEKIAAALESFSIPVARNEETNRPPDWPMARAYLSLLSNPSNDLLMYWWLVRVNGKKCADALKLQSLRESKPIVSMLERQHLFPANPPASELPRLMAEQGIGQESIVLIQKAAATLAPGATLTELAAAMNDEDLHRKQVGSGVVITTIHSAKGREWDHVYCLAFEQGILPKESANTDLEEERRVAFVAFTRARKSLTLSWANKRRPLYRRGELEPANPSQFVIEAGLATT